MRIALVAIVALVAFVGEARAQRGTQCVLNTRLLPENEVRTAANTADPTVESTATGHAQVKVRSDGTLEVKVFILNQDAETFVAGHIHEGGPTVNGPIVVTLFEDPGFSETHLVQHEVVPEARFAEGVDPEDLLEDLCENPGAYYVNYHTTQDPVGATRGQLH